MKVAGAVVLYNSPNSCLDNIYTYLHQVQTLYVIDNSEKYNETLINLLKAIPKIEYISCGGNYGIAYALNKAAQRALVDKYEYLLTMDDDSQVPMNLIELFTKYLDEKLSIKPIGIISVPHSPSTNRINRPNPVLYTMTSGNLLSLGAYQTVGSFREDLFIDHVDHEYCLRLNKANFQVIELPNIHIIHNLGSLKEKFGMKFVSHTPLRQYYIIRNGLKVSTHYFFKYPVFLLITFRVIFKELIKTFFLEDSKKERIQFTVKGLFDYIRCKSGSYHD